MAEQSLILVVDDEENFREIFSIKLKAAGYRVETAENGAQGIEKAKSLKPALILMDVNMPVMDGAQAVLKLREDPDPAVKNAKVAFLTSLGDPHAEIQNLNVKYSEDFGAQGYLRKTDDLDSLVHKIGEFLK
jgi:two-component system, OmpR family, alkaline phosphatase synthesis response regulator PhoP